MLLRDFGTVLLVAPLKKLGARYKEKVITFLKICKVYKIARENSGSASERSNTCFELYFG